HTIPAKDFLWAKNSLTQRVIGPVSSGTTTLDATSLKTGDYAGLAILNMPFATLGVHRNNDGFLLRFYDQYANKTIDSKLGNGKITLRITGNYDEDIAQFSYSTNGNDFTNIGDSIRLPYQLKTFQGSRYALFAYNTEGKEGGYADFLNFVMDEPMADRSKNIPMGKVITLTNMANNSRLWANPHGMLHSAAPGSQNFNGSGAQFRVHDKGKGRVVLEALNGTRFLAGGG